MLSLDNFILKHSILCCDVTIDAINKIGTIHERYTYPKRTSDLYLFTYLYIFFIHLVTRVLSTASFQPARSVSLLFSVIPGSNLLSAFQ